MKPGFQLIDTVGEDSTHSSSQVSLTLLLIHNSLGCIFDQGVIVFIGLHQKYGLPCVVLACILLLVTQLLECYIASVMRGLPGVVVACSLLPLAHLWENYIASCMPHDLGCILSKTRFPAPRLRCFFKAWHWSQALFNACNRCITDYYSAHDRVLKNVWYKYTVCY